MVLSPAQCTIILHKESHLEVCIELLKEDNFGAFCVGLLSTLHFQNEDVTKVGITRMVASATQNILKETEKMRGGQREIHQARIDLVDSISIDIDSLKLLMRICYIGFRSSKNPSTTNQNTGTC